MAQSVAWGANDFGPTRRSGRLKRVVAVSAGDYHTLALQEDGTVRGWGRNDYGQTSIPDNLTNVVAVAAGEWCSMALVLGALPPPPRTVD